MTNFKTNRLILLSLILMVGSTVLQNASAQQSVLQNEDGSDSMLPPVGAKAHPAELPSLILDDGIATLRRPDFCFRTPQDPANEEKLFVLDAAGKFIRDEAGVIRPYTQQNVSDYLCEVIPEAIKMERVVFAQRRFVEYLENLTLDNRKISSVQAQWLAELKQEYGLKPAASFDEVLERVDIIPLPQLLGQGALESNWGQSRFAVNGNNLFGVHGSRSDGPARCNMVGQICVRKYTNIGQSISDYIFFVNHEPPQDDFRKARVALRKVTRLGAPLDSAKLIESLSHYSQIGAAYATRVEGVINSAHMNRFAFDEGLMPEIPLSGN